MAMRKSIEFRSDLLKFHRVMSKIRNQIRDGHLEKMRLTPFWGLFKSYYDGLVIELPCRKSDQDVVSIVRCSNQDREEFVFGQLSATITSNDIGELFGLHDGRRKIKLHKRKRKNKDSDSESESDFKRRQFAGVARMSKKILEDKIFSVVSLHGSVNEDDFVRLVALYFCVSLLFSNSGNYLGWKLIGYIEDIGSMSDYAWASAVNDNLEESLINMTRPEGVSGCVVAILFWFCVWSKLIKPISGREQFTPKFLRWNLQELYARMKTVDIRSVETHMLIHEPSPGNFPIIPHQEKTCVIVLDSSPKTPAIGKEIDVSNSNSVLEIRESHRMSVDRFVDAPNFHMLIHEPSSAKIPMVPHQEKTSVIVQDSRPKTPASGKEIVLSNSKSLLEIRESHRMSIDKCDDAPQFQLFPSQGLMDSPPGPSSSKRDYDETENEVKKLGELLEIEQARTTFLISENEMLTEEIERIKESKKEEQNPDVNSMYIRLKSKSRLPLIRPDFYYPDDKGNTGINSLKMDGIKACGVNDPNGVIAVRRLRVGKCLSDHDAIKLKHYLESAGPWTFLWKGEYASVCRDAALDLLKENIVSLQIIDSYSEVRNNEPQAQPNNMLKSYFMPTFGWDLVKNGNTAGKIAVYLELLAKHFQHKEFVFFPLISHTNPNQFTLLVLNKSIGKWEHYNPQFPRCKAMHDLCFIEAKRLHDEIGKHFKSVKQSAATSLASGSIWKHHMKGGRVYTSQYTMNEEERAMILWFKDANVDFAVQANHECPQQEPGSVDSGLAVMYYMRELSNRAVLEAVFNPQEMKKMRAYVLGRLMNDVNSWVDDKPN